MVNEEEERKEEEEEERIKEKESAFNGWKRQKDEREREEMAAKREAKRKEILEKRKEEREKEEQAETSFFNWIEHKERQKSIEKMKRFSKSQMLLRGEEDEWEEKTRPWYPSGKTVPFNPHRM